VKNKRELLRKIKTMEAAAKKTLAESL